MNVSKAEIERVEAMLDSYKANHETIDVSVGESSNCSVCTSGCSGRCDGSGGGGICWGNSWRR